MSTAYVETSLGLIKVEADEEYLYSLYFVDQVMPPKKRQGQMMRHILHQLEEYFKGTRKNFDIPVNPAGSTFQQMVWEKLSEIPYGQTITYGELAEQCGGPAYSRAVGSANGNNPISIIIPCHRVIGFDGKLVGYAGGLWRKQWLLEHESGNFAGKQINIQFP
ncbi:MAG: methylated-DNA--[protein]-cysteine S-methyltransferase [Bacteroidota bacterium]